MAGLESAVSEQLVTGLAEDAICSVCHEEYKDPRFLPCHHYFCRDCIDRCLEADPSANVLICPECREETPRPPAADRLKPAYPANRLTTRLQEARARLTQHKACEYMCSQHSTIKVEFFCFECNQLVCEACTHKEHMDHRVEHVREAAEYHRDVFKSACEGLKAVKEEIEGSRFRNNFVVRKEAILKQADRVSAEVVQSFDEMIGSLISRKEELLKFVSDSKDQQLAYLEEEESTIANLIASASDLVEKVATLQSSSEFEFLNTAQQLIDMALSRREMLSNVSLKPTQVTDIAARITCVEDIKELCQTKAAVFVSQVQLLGGLCVAELGEPHSFHICPAAPVSSAEAISATLTSLQGKVIIPLKVFNVPGSALYEATYTPKERGRHRLVVDIGGQPVTGGLIDVCIYPKLTGDRVPEFSWKVTSPTCVAINSQGQVIISSSIRNHVSVRTRKGKKLFELKGRKLCSPYGVAVDKEDNIFVTEEAAHLVSKFSPDGKFIKLVGRQGGEAGEFDSPKAVRVIRNQVYVCDQKNRRIQVLSVDLEHLTTFNMDLQPTDVALGAQSSLYIVGLGGSQGIHLYDSKGFMYQGMIQHKDLCPLSGICFDVVQSFIYAANIINCCVIQMTPAGEYVATFCRRGTGDGELSNPCGIAVDPDGYLYVCDTGNGRVLVF
eukprot:Em0080g6a